MTKFKINDFLILQIIKSNSIYKTIKKNFDLHSFEAIDKPNVIDIY